MKEYFIILCKQTYRKQIVRDEFVLGESADANVTSAGAYPWSCIENNPVPQPQCCGVMSFEPR